MGKRATLWVSSVTGNTAKIAEGVRATLVDLGWSVRDVDGNAREARDAGGDAREARDADAAVPDAEVVIVCFWCRKGTLDPKSMKFIDECENKKVLLFGTMAHWPVGKYGALVRERVAAKVNERNECLGVFLCQGRVRPERIEERRALPVDHPHHLDDWGVVRLVESQGHPNATDVLYAQAFARDYLPS